MNQMKLKEKLLITGDCISGETGYIEQNPIMVAFVIWDEEVTNNSEFIETFLCTC